MSKTDRERGREYAEQLKRIKQSTESQGIVIALLKNMEVEISPEKEAEILNNAVSSAPVVTLSDDDEWKPGVKVTVGTRLKYNGSLYEVITPHITQSDWTPNITPALFRTVQKEPEGGGILPWIAGETVKAGDKRKYSNTVYECIQGHTTQTGWEPPKVAALWKTI